MPSPRITLSQAAGVIRALAPAAIAYAAGRGLDLSWLLNPDIIALLAALLAAGWSVQSKRKPRTPDENQSR